MRHNRAMGITSDEVARRLGVDVERVEELVRAGAIEQTEPGRFAPDDIHRVRLLVAFQSAGVPLDALVAAYRSGRVTFEFYDELHPPPGPASDRSYAAFARSLADDAAHHPRLLAARGLAEPEPDTS